MEGQSHEPHGKNLARQSAIFSETILDSLEGVVGEAKSLKPIENCLHLPAVVSNGVFCK